MPIKPGNTLLFGAVLLATLSVHAQTTVPTPQAETRHTAAGVIATDEHWGLAEQLGDTDYLGSMLLPDYQSVDIHTGAAHNREQILHGAAKRRGTPLADARKKIDDYRKAHPYGTTVVIHGDIAILDFYDLAKGPKSGITSVDIFVYTGGRWRGIYSQ